MRHASGMIAIAAGIGVVAWLPRLPHYGLLLVLLLPLVLLALTLPHRRLVSVAVLLLLGLAYGTAYGNGFLAALLPPELETRDIVLTGAVASVPDFSPQLGGTYRFDFHVNSALVGGSPCCEHLRRVRLSFRPAQARSDPVPAKGDHWRFTARLKRPRGFANPGAFDYTRWLVARGIHASGYVRESERLTHNRGMSRGAVVRYLRARLAGKEQRGVMLALAVGDRALLDDEQWALFRLTGISHLMAISGLHIGIAAGLGLLLGRVLQTLAALRGRDQPFWPWLLSALLALIYAWLAGLSLPTLRALIMVGVALLVLSADRTVDRWQIFAAALLLVLLLNPLAVLQAGFWLSFVAVAVLLACAERGRPSSLIRAQWVLLLGLMPFTALFFQQFSPLSLPVNLVLVPLFSVLIVPLVLLALAMELVSSASADLLWQWINAILEQCFMALEVLVARSRHWVWSLHLSPPEFAGAVLGVVLLLLPRALPARYLGWVCLLPIVVGTSNNQLDEGYYRMTTLDVGQGLAVVVETANHVLVYDVGPRYSPRLNMVEAAVLPYLRQRGQQAVDVLMISHGDSDHAGAYQKLLDAVPVGRLLAGEPLQGTEPCVTGQGWHWDGVEFHVFGPRRNASGNGNNRSCVLVLRAGSRHSVLPGDIETSRELTMLPVLPTGVDVLVAPHHGSKTSSSQAFVDALAPQLVIFSSGYKHHFGHPAQEVEARYRVAGADTLGTANSGAISVTAGPEGVVSVERFRAQHRYYWNQVAD